MFTYWYLAEIKAKEDKHDRDVELTGTSNLTLRCFDETIMIKNKNFGWKYDFIELYYGYISDINLKKMQSLWFGTFKTSYIIPEVVQVL